MPHVTLRAWRYSSCSRRESRRREWSCICRAYTWVLCVCVCVCVCLCVCVCVSVCVCVCLCVCVCWFVFKMVEEHTYTNKPNPTHLQQLRPPFIITTPCPPFSALPLPPLPLAAPQQFPHHPVQPPQRRQRRAAAAGPLPPVPSPHILQQQVAELQVRLEPQPLVRAARGALHNRGAGAFGSHSGNGLVVPAAAAAPQPGQSRVVQTVEQREVGAGGDVIEDAVLVWLWWCVCG